MPLCVFLRALKATRRYLSGYPGCKLISILHSPHLPALLSRIASRLARIPAQLTALEVEAALPWDLHQR